MKINPYAKGAASGAYEQGVKTAADYAGVTSQLAANASISGTTQVPTFNSDGTIQKIEHKDSSNVIVRLDEFAYGTNTITETRKLNGTLYITLIYHLDTLRTEVI